MIIDIYIQNVYVFFFNEKFPLLIFIFNCNFSFFSPTFEALILRIWSNQYFD